MLTSHRVVELGSLQQSSHFCSSHLCILRVLPSLRQADSIGITDEVRQHSSHCCDLATLALLPYSGSIVVTALMRQHGCYCESLAPAPTDGLAPPPTASLLLTIILTVVEILQESNPLVELHIISSEGLFLSLHGGRCLLLSPTAEQAPRSARQGKQDFSWSIMSRCVVLCCLSCIVTIIPSHGVSSIMLSVLCRIDHPISWGIKRCTTLLHCTSRYAMLQAPSPSARIPVRSEPKEEMK